jgi:hypothetical protein
MSSYIIRNIDDELWDRFKKRAESEGRGQGLRWVFQQFIEYYADNGLPKPKAIHAPR